MHHRAWIILLSACLAALPTVAADPVSSPPELSGSYDETTQTVQLNWTATDGAAAYHVYRDGKLLANTTQTVLNDTVDGKLHVYTVTAYEGQESPPSNPYTFTELVPDRVAVPGEDCEPVVIIVGLDPPGVDPGFHSECLPSLPIENPIIGIQTGD